MIIYKIENKLNGKIYIGQTKRKLSRRISAHIYLNKYPIGKALNKYGLESFTVSVIDEADTPKILSEKESHWINYYNCLVPGGYNIIVKGAPLYDYPLDIRKKLSDAGRLGRGEKRSLEARKNISEGLKKAYMGKKREPQSAEVIMKIRKAMKAHWDKKLSKINNTTDMIN